MVGSNPWHGLINSFNFLVFILLSRESDGGATHKTNPDSLRSLRFRVFQLSFASDLFNLLLVRFHQAESTLSEDVTTRLGWELNHQPCDQGRHGNDAANHLATLPASSSNNPVLCCNTM